MTEDDELWQHLQREVQPLRRTKKPIKIKNVSASLRAKADDILPPASKKLPKKWQCQEMNFKIKAPPPALPAAGVAADKLAPLRNGRAVIDASLDLHGLTQAEAHQELGYFLKKQIARGARCVLIVTGKGRAGGGILRQSLPKWLMTGTFARAILTIHPAHQKHGGDGATYVLLRRKEAR